MNKPQIEISSKGRLYIDIQHQMMASSCYAKRMLYVMLAGAALVKLAYADNVLTLVPSGVSSVAEGLPTPTNPMTLWASIPDCYKQSEVQPHPSGDGNQPVQFLRGSREGDKPRAIMSFNPSRPADQCNPFRLLSNIVSDGTDIFYVANPNNNHAGLWRRPLNSNSQDPSTLVKDLGSAALVKGAEVHLNKTYNTVVFVIVHYQENLFTTAHDEIQEYTKTGNFLGIVDQGAQDSIRGMKSDDRYLYWRRGLDLRQNDMTNGVQATVLSKAIDTYETIGQLFRFSCGQLVCPPQSQLLYSTGSQIHWLEAVRGGTAVEYTSKDGSARFFDMTHDAHNEYFIESRYLGSPFAALSEQRIYKQNTLGDLTWIGGPFTGTGLPLSQLQTDGSYLYFAGSSNRSLFRLANNAGQIPIFNVVSDGLEVTQGLQSRRNQVRLIENKRTFARFYVKSADNRDVPGVTAVLRGFNENGVFLGELAPINTIGKRITVKANPSRANVDESFLFEIPLSWTLASHSPIQLQATVNPNGLGIAEDVINDNSTALNVGFTASPRLEVEYVNFKYAKDGTTYSVSREERGKSQSWLRKVYPLALPSKFSDPGLHFINTELLDNNLTSHADWTHDDCKALKTDSTDDRNLCASNYVHAVIAAKRKDGTLRSSGVSYGNIPVMAGTGVRGWGAEASRIGSGPSGSGVEEENYAAHEIGHTLGRLHPESGKTCSGSMNVPSGYTPGTRKVLVDGVLVDQVEKNPPFPGAAIADFNIANYRETEVAGFLVNASNVLFSPVRGSAPLDYQFLDAQTNHDLMAYCANYWISQYNYEGIFNYLKAGVNFGLAATAGPVQAAGAVTPGDWLIVTGTIHPGGGTAIFGILNHTDSVTDDTPPEAGDYTFKALNGSGQTLSSHRFDASKLEDSSGEVLSFDFVVPFMQGVSKLQIIENTSGKVLVNKNVSTHLPSVTNPTLVNPTDPVEGTVRISWTASDADADPLSFDLLVSRDDGMTFKPLVLSIHDTHYDLDTSQLAGGSTLIRVVASDGMHTAHADSASFVVKPKPPIPLITAPADGMRAQWGQLVTLEMSAEDAQDGEVADENIVWYNHYGVLGTGHILQTDQLPVGNYGIAVAATNSLGLQAVASIQVSVNDNLNSPGPTLSSAPTTLFFTVAPDESATQSAQLAISNAGSSALAFSASSDAEWLKLAGANGATGQIASIAAPANLGVTVNSSLVPAYTETTGHITLQNLADPEDKLTIPVTIAKGRPEDRPPPVDSDADGIPDTVDNCIQVPNSTQLDTDSDGFGNYCDGDLNNDSQVNSLDLGLFKRTYLASTPNLAADFNGDGKVNSLDLGLFKKMYLKPVGPSAKTSN